MRFASKAAFIADIECEYAALVRILDSIPRARYEDPGVWGDGWTVKDLLTHLTAWHQMCLRWFNDGKNGTKPAIPAPGYKYNQTPALNRMIREQHRGEAAPAARKNFDASHAAVMKLVRSLPEAQLLEPGHYAWTGKNPLTTYIGPNTCSHYRFAIKVLKRYLKANPGVAGGADPDS